MAAVTTLPAAFTVGQILTSTQMNNLRGAFRILQVVSATTTSTVTTTSTSYITTNLTASITPSATSSKILVFASLPLRKVTDSIFSEAYLQAFRGTVAGTALTTTQLNLFVEKPVIAQQTMIALDSPSTVSAQAYTVGVKSASGLVTIETGTNGNAGTIILMEVSA
jgi:hypothetical protein